MLPFIAAEVYWIPKRLSRVLSTLPTDVEPALDYTNIASYFSVQFTFFICGIPTISHGLHGLPRQIKHAFTVSIRFINHILMFACGFPVWCLNPFNFTKCKT